jgi:H+-transporting ATPase
MSPTPNVWRVGSLTAAGVILGFFDLLFCTGVIAIGKYQMGLGIDALRTLSIVTLIFSGQATLYVVRERRRLWSSRPSTWLMAASGVDLLIISELATRGVLMTPMPIVVVATTLAATAVFGLILDLIKVPVFRRMQII